MRLNNVNKVSFQKITITFGRRLFTALCFLVFSCWSLNSGIELRNLTPTLTTRTWRSLRSLFRRVCKQSGSIARESGDRANKPNKTFLKCRSSNAKFCSFTNFIHLDTVHSICNWVYRKCQDVSRNAYFDCMQKAKFITLLDEVCGNNKFLLENCAEEMNNVRITTSCSSFKAVRRSVGLNITSTQIWTFKGVSITR